MKQAIRNNIKVTIQNTPPAVKAQATDKIRALLLTYLKQNNLSAAKIAGYIPMPYELDISPILYALEECGFSICLPCTPQTLKPLVFRHYKVGDELIFNPFWPALQEPPAHNEIVIPDVVITPLLAFDATLNRIGQGKGFYDVTFADFQAGGIYVRKVGLALELQRVEKIIPQAHDVRLDAVITAR